LLVAVNLVPLVGVLFFHWSVATVLVAYWLENGVIGVINVPKILIAGRDSRSRSSSRAAPGLALFFIFHYGLFWVVHGVFVFVLTSLSGVLTTGFFGVLSPTGPFSDGTLDGTIPTSVTNTSGVSLPTVAFMALLLLISHGTSFFVNYIGRGEFRRTTPQAQMFQPYGRLVILHVTIVIGAFFVIFLGQPVALVALLVLLKTLFDLALHVREHGATKPNVVIS
jgi:hypothetical protein